MKNMFGQLPTVRGGRVTDTDWMWSRVLVIPIFHLDKTISEQLSALYSRGVSRERIGASWSSLAHSK